LDTIPFKDISSENQYLIEDNVLTRNISWVNNTENNRFFLVSSRGCPYNCSYCCEDFYKNLYLHQKFLRRRSVQNVVQELEEAKKSINYKEVLFEDEVFSFDYEWLEKFKDLYVKRINLPFICYIYPNRDIEKILKTLKESGLFSTCLAIQSGSERINKEIFFRKFSKDLFLQTAQILKSLGIAFYSDIITFNPFETENDLKATLNILSELPKPFHISVNKLYTLKGTKIFDIVNKKVNESGNRYQIPERIFYYYARLFWLATRYDKRIINLILRIRIFKYFPMLFDVSRKLLSLQKMLRQ
jgi:Fe-S oxidoreductase